MEWIALVVLCGCALGLGRLVGWWALLAPPLLALLIAELASDLENSIGDILALVFGLATFAAALAGALWRAASARERI